MMYRIFSITLLVIASLPAFCQLRSVFKQEYNAGKYDSRQEDALYRNGYYYVAGSSDDNILNEPSIYKIDLQGNMIWTSTYVNPPYPPISSSEAFRLRVNKLFFLEDGLYANSREEVWKIDTLTGTVIWKVPVDFQSFAERNFIDDFDAETFVLFYYQKIELRSKETGELIKQYNNPDSQNDWWGYYLDQDHNFYIAKEEYLIKYDSLFNPVWSSFIANGATVSDVFFHEYTQKLILTTHDNPYIYTADPVSGEILSDAKLRKYPEGNVRVKEAFLDEPDGAYFVWLSTTLSNGEFTLTKIQPSTGDSIYHREILFTGPSSESSNFAVTDDHVYLGGIDEAEIASEYNLAIASFDRYTGALEYKRTYLDSFDTNYSFANDLEVINGQLYLAFHHSVLTSPTTVKEGSGLLVADAATGDSIRLMEFPGRWQNPTQTNALLAYDENTIVAVSQLGHVMDVSQYDYALNPIFSFHVANRRALQVVLTPDRIGILASSVQSWETPEELLLFDDRWFMLFSYDGELKYQTQLASGETYSLAAHQGLIQVMILDDPYWLRQTKNDALVQVIPGSEYTGASLWARFLPWQDTTSIFIDRYFTVPLKGLIIKHFHAESQSVKSVDTIFNVSQIGSSVIEGNNLYLSTNLFNHPTSTNAFFKYDLLTHQKIWDLTDRSYHRLYFMADQLIGVFGIGPKTYIHAIDPQNGDVIWERIFDISISKLKTKPDHQGRQMCVYAYPDLETGVEYISMYLISDAGDITQPFRYTGARPEINQLHDVLPFSFHGESYYLTAGAFFHPTLRKTAFIHLYSGKLFNEPLEMNVFFDKNENQIKDPDESSIGYGTLLVNNRDRIHLNNQEFNYYPHGAMIDTIQYLPIPGWYLTTDSIQFVSNLDSSVEFGVSTHNTIDSILPVMTLVGRWRCYREVEITAQAINTGTESANGEMKIVVPDAFSVLETSIPIDHVSGDTLFFTFQDLSPGFYENIDLIVQVPGPSSDIYEFKAIVDFTTTQSIEKSVSTVVQDQVTCGYDPNDKLVNPARGANNPTLKNEDIHYTIRFQNTGNDTTFRVEILDTLSSSFDLTTLNVLGSSHPCEVTLRNNILKAVFIPIDLPDSTTNYLASQGFLQFSIRAKEGLSENTQIENKATIYFEFNEGVVTNTTTSTLVSNLGVSTLDPDFVRPLRLVPNPATEHIYLFSEDTDLTIPHRIVIRDAAGKVCFQSFTGLGERLDVEALLPGIYLVEVAGFETQRFFKVR